MTWQTGLFIFLCFFLGRALWEFIKWIARRS